MPLIFLYLIRPFRFTTSQSILLKIYLSIHHKTLHVSSLSPPFNSSDVRRSHKLLRGSRLQRLWYKKTVFHQPASSSCTRVDGLGGANTFIDRCGRQNPPTLRLSNRMELSKCHRYFKCFKGRMEPCSFTYHTYSDEFVAWLHIVSVFYVDFES